jgi:hypothetical protein
MSPILRRSAAATAVVFGLTLAPMAIATVATPAPSWADCPPGTWWDGYNCVPVPAVPEVPTVPAIPPIPSIPPIPPIPQP